MKLDLYTRFVLSIIAVCAILLVAQSLGFGARASDEADPIARYRIAIAGPMVFRIDTQTGDIWRMPFRGGTEWQLVLEPSAEEEPEPEEEEDWSDETESDTESQGSDE